jgi:2-keto-4-pentenoate hydratase
VLAATDYIVAAIEIADSRIVRDHKKMIDSIADEGSFGACVLHTVRFNPNDVDLKSESVDVYINNRLRESGRFAEVMNDPVNSVVWLANILAKRNQPLRAGATILSGSSIAPIAVNQGDSVVLKYSSIGTMRLEFR